MAIDLTGIQNQNEYYSQHYLLALFEGDLKETLRRWDTRAADQPESEEHRPPPARLRALAAPYFRLYNRFNRLHEANTRQQEQTRWLNELLHTLGYTPHPEWINAGDKGYRLPILARVNKNSGAPLLWILPALPPADDPSSDALSLGVDPAQFEGDPDLDNPQATHEPPPADLTWEDLITRHIFSLDEPPRWVLLVSFGQIALLDRTKWPERKYLAFDLREILNRREDSTLKAAAALLHRESLCPDDGFALLDTLDEQSHRHAFAVSEDLKDAVRECVELLGNEAVYYLREIRKEAVYSTPDQELADQLTRGCLRYLYRLLFVLYLEARPELGYLPIKSEEYLKGYSLESLRDLELTALHSDEQRNGTFFDTSIRLLFRLIFEGRQTELQTMLGQNPSIVNDFEIAPLKSHLFDPKGTPHISKVRFRNVILQEVIRRLSLGKQGAGRHARSGRISYAQLGINQLGAVYENLLAYSGFFAKTELYEVKPADTPHDPLRHAYFVTGDDLEHYTDEERVYEPGDGQAPRRLLRHPKGKFIYRLAGRNREKTASYYTPDSLTACTIKYALKEWLTDKTADEILETAICEMAIGMASFSNETIDQLADAYLRAKQKETGQTIPHQDYAQEKQRVKMRLADDNVYGVDLNPTAVELAEISLWLNTIYAGAHVPWFGLQLANGNSLVGARRQTWSTDQLNILDRPGGRKARWTEAVPDPVRWPDHPLPPDAKPVLTDRPADAIYHWLVPDPGMSLYNDKVVKGLKKKEIAAINTWRKTFCTAFDRDDLNTLRALSDAADALWQRHLDAAVKLRQQTDDVIPVWPEPFVKPTGRTTQEKDRLLAEGIKQPYSAYRRLKLSMDYWCALWFWPIDQADHLPTRDQFLMELSVLLGVTPTTSETPKQGELFVDIGGVRVDDVQPALDYNDPAGIVNVDELCRKLPRLGLVAAIASQRKFLHWELEFVEIFARRGGFDLIAGNPPWIKIEWNEGGLLSERNPAFAIRKLSASGIAKARDEQLTQPGRLEEYLREYEEFEGQQNFLNALQNYPLLKGQQTNLYKCFITRAWEISQPRGVTAFLHPEGVYDDPNGGAMRRALYPRLRSHFQFENQLILFSEVHHNVKFSVNITHDQRETIGFRHLANLFSPATVDACFEHSGSGPIVGIKNDAGKWATEGHRDRIIEVDADTLRLFATLYDAADTPAHQARLPALHSRQLVNVLNKFAAYSDRLSDLKDHYLALEMWHETNAQKEGTIRRETSFPPSPHDLILSGPHFSVGNPLNKTPREVCTLNSHYDVLDLTHLPDDYLPRTNYLPDCNPEEYHRRTPTVPWDNTKRVTEYYRLAFRRQLSQSGERTLIPALVPPGCGHINPVISCALPDPWLPSLLSGFFASVPADFMLKSTGKGDLYESVLRNLPIPSFSNDWKTGVEKVPTIGKIAQKSSNDWKNGAEFFQRLENTPENLPMIGMLARALALNSLTVHYADLWAECWTDAYRELTWHSDDPRLDPDFWKNLTPDWTRNCALRTDYARRWALVELDVFAARALGLTLEELQSIYRIQFPVMRQYEADTWYDQSGRIVFTNSKGLPGVGFTRAEWNEIKDMTAGTVTRTLTDTTLPTGPLDRTLTYTAPFTRCDRERDYAAVWENSIQAQKEQKPDRCGRSGGLHGRVCCRGSYRQRLL
jgi:hypothetical protein